MNLRTVVGLVLGASLALSVYGEEAKTEDLKKSAAKKEARTKQSDEPSGAIRLESVFVGDKEQPAISYFIPWQGVGAPDKLHWNVEEKHDKALESVDREIMLRSIHFYGEMKLEAPDAQ